MAAPSRLSLTAVWDETRAYVAREAALLLPVSLATVGLASMLLTLAFPEGHAVTDPGGPERLWAIPSGALFLFGLLALCLLALSPGIRVGDALRRAGTRFGAALGAFLLTGVGVMAMFVVGGVVVAVIGAAAGLPLERAAQLGVILVMPAILILSARLMLALPAVASGEGAIAALVRSWRLTAPIAAKLTALLLAANILSALILIAAEAAVGSAILLAAKIAGADALGRMLVDLLGAFLSSVLQIVATSYVSFAYRRLTEPDRTFV